MQTSLYTPKIKRILSKSKGLKVALFDKRSYTVLSTCVPHTYFLNNDYFLLTMIEDKKRIKMEQLTCCAFISKEGIANLMQELKEPFYGAYNLYFLNAVNEDSLKELAKADTSNKVNEVFEIFIDMHQIDDKLFVINEKEEEIGDNHRINSIVSILNTLEIQPIVCSSTNLKDFANELAFSIEKYSLKKCGNVFIFDRKKDMITPLVFNWYYQPMLYDYTDYSLGLITLHKKTYQIFNDDIFTKTRFTNIAELKNQILETKEQKSEKIDFDDLFKTNILTDNNNKIETHLTLHNFITAGSVKNGLLSDLEYTIISDKSFFKNNQEKIHSVLKDKNINFHFRLKFFLINTLCHLDIDSKKDVLISNWFVKKYPEFIEYFYKFLDLYQPKKDILPSFAKEKDLKLGYTPVIMKYIKNLINNQTKNFYFARKSLFRKNEQLILYFKGGITLYEYQCIQQQYPNTIVLADHLIGYKNILERIVS
ncbi:Sec1-like vacuolar sorting-associated protein [Tubulinosema ratisbonensis]|uniref:Sec1-like vacuolar sorting-associated protein n=1 Tax=Tubulinosema ratisbonensis TaxID=291195 RepID=A0A437AN79_9MICR|nr:Sec1-like vacuolar sorting-associated protein [Tubulinosema ratisbonensis]